MLDNAQYISDFKVQKATIEAVMGEWINAYAASAGI
jgi:hypothetical protein